MAEAFVHKVACSCRFPDVAVCDGFSFKLRSKNPPAFDSGPGFGNISAAPHPPQVQISNKLQKTSIDDRRPAGTPSIVTYTETE